MLLRLLAAALLCFLVAGCTNEDAASPAESPGPGTDPSDPRAASTLAMIERLEAAAPDVMKDWTTRSRQRAEFFRSRISRAKDEQEKFGLRMRVGNELLSGGFTDDAIAEFEAAIADQPQIAAEIPIVSELLVTAWLRKGEQANCLAQHGPDSCLMPIRGAGVHADKTGSTKAVELLQDKLKDDPRNLGARWLLNIAHMTLGTYPAEVPPQFMIPPETFAGADSPGEFENIATRTGSDVRSLAGGVVADDLDGDELIDLMVSDWATGGQLRFLKNDGRGRFIDRTQEAGLEGLVGGLNLIHADVDDDGDLDVYVLRGAWLLGSGDIPNSLLLNLGNGRFRDVTVEAGLLSAHPSHSAVWADFDRDGKLDLFVANEAETRPDAAPIPCELYRNRGDGTFEEIAAQVGLDISAFVKGVAAGDTDSDGDIDLYLSTQNSWNLLLENNDPGGENWRFEDVSKAAGVRAPKHSFPTWFFDADNDGDLDIFVAPFPGFLRNSLGDIAADYLGLPSNAPKARYYRNRGDGTFEDASSAAGLAKPMLAMGANYGDLDNDGYEDIYIGTGEPNLQTLVPNRMYSNIGGDRFENVTFSGRFGHLQKGHGIAFADFDNDGDQDVYAVMGGSYQGDLAYNALFQNPGTPNDWITLRLEGTKSPRCAIGARVRVDVTSATGPRTFHRVVGTGGSFGSQSLQQEIGLGASVESVRVTVTWPRDGATQTFEIQKNAAWRIVEGKSDAIAVEMVNVDM